MAAVSLENSTLYTDGNLQHYWKLEGLADEIGSATLTNSGSTTFTSGLFDNAATFTKTAGQELTYSAGTSAVSGNYSWGFWIKLTTEITTGFYGLNQIDYESGSTSDVKTWFLYNYNSGTPQIIGTRDGASQTDTTYNISLGTTNWHLIGQTYDGSNLRLYIDGVLRDTQSASGTASKTTQGIVIGDVNRFGGLNYPALVDDMFVLNRVMSDTEWSDRYDGSDATGGGGGSGAFAQSVIIA